ncbi:MAG: V-type ATPase subunit [Candidatus Bathyarchaeota archaeon]|nr:V-type ATPase subunit [Candidatus Bathyarchaeota archaeon]
MHTYLITRCHGLITHLLSPQIIESLSTTKTFQEILDILNPTDYGRNIREKDQIDAFKLENIFNKKLIDRCEYLLKVAPENIREFLITYYRKFEIQNIMRLFRGKISRVPIEISEYALFPVEDISRINFEVMAETGDAEEFILTLKNTPYGQVIKSIEWYRKYNSFLPIEFHLKQIYYNMVFQTLGCLPKEDKEKVSRLIRAHIDIENCFTIIASSVYNYDEELIESLLIPYPLRLSLPTLKKVIRTQSPQEILKLMSPYSEVLKHSLTKDETLAHTAALRLLLNEVMQQRIIDSMNFTYVMYYLFLCEFECRDLTFIAIAKHHNIEPGSYLVHKI